MGLVRCVGRAKGLVNRAGVATPSKSVCVCVSLFGTPFKKSCKSLLSILKVYFVPNMHRMQHAHWDFSSSPSLVPPNQVFDLIQSVFMKLKKQNKFILFYLFVLENKNFS